jgi:hypothetical protein
LEIHNSSPQMRTSQLLVAVVRFSLSLGVLVILDRCASNHLYHYKIINGKEVEVSTEEDMLDFDEDENSPKVSLATITCIR